MALRIGTLRLGTGLSSFRQSVRYVVKIAEMHTSDSEQKKLFTPGPLGVSLSTKQAMLRDVGSRDTNFISIVRNIRDRLVSLSGVTNQDYTCVPMQGSGSFALESVLSTVVPPAGKVLILENGAYGKRQAKICDVLKIPYHQASFPEEDFVKPDVVKQLLEKDSYCLVSVVHCETSSGVINPINEIGQLVKSLNPDAAYFVDAMSSFGAIPMSLAESKTDYMVSSANKCLEGVPGFSFAICRKEHLLTCKGRARSYVLDLVDQYEGLEKNGQFRFTPPTHAMLALDQALHELQEEGGIQGRSKRYQENREILRKGMAKMGFKEFLGDSHKGYIITSYCFPGDKNFDFTAFYQKLSRKGQVIYPGKVLNADCFRIGNIGNLFPADMEHLLKCVGDVCGELNIRLPLKK